MVSTEVVAERRGLIALAYRMLGTIADAEDAVQETYARWYRMDPLEQGRIENPAAWLTRVASRICLDQLGSARVRREQYVGPWLPEPVPTDAFGPAGDPADRVALDDTISTALLVVLESMTPAERVAFVLHDVFALPFAEIAEVVGRSPAACRQLATAARRRVQDARARAVPRDEHDRIVRAFAAATRTGELAELVALLDPSVVLRSDGGGVVSAARNPVHGPDHVARFLLGIAAKRPAVDVQLQETPDGLGFAMWDEGRIVGVITVEVTDDRVRAIRMVLNPAKLTLWA